MQIVTSITPIAGAVKGREYFLVRTADEENKAIIEGVAANKKQVRQLAMRQLAFVLDEVLSCGETETPVA